jgi:hypothetical protein
MPQLRLANSSILVAESDSYLDLAVVARKIGIDQFIFDDVGLGFNVDSALAEADARTADIDTTGIENQDILDEIAKQISDAKAHLVDLEGAAVDSLNSLLAQNDPAATPVIVGIFTPPATPGQNEV